MSEQIVPPHSIEAERSVLGAIMLDNRVLDEVSQRVTPVDFYRADHRLIYSTMLAHSEQEKPCDAVTLCETLDAQGKLSAAGDLLYVGALARDCPTAANAIAYADIVRERAMLRQVLQTAADLMRAATDRDSLDAIIERAQESVLSLTAKPRRGDVQHITERAGDWIDDLDARLHSVDGITGTPTRFTDLDRLTSGMADADLWILAARPSMGKSALAVNLALNVAQHKPVMMFSLEMSNNQLLNRAVAKLGKIPLEHLRHPKELNEEGWQKITASIRELRQRQFYVDETPGLSVSDMLARARKQKAKTGLCLVIVDHLQLVDSQGESETAKITAVSRGLKRLAKALNCPVLALAQLNRNLELRHNKRPQLSDLRQSGAIEEDADNIIFLYRESYYRPDFMCKGVAELDVAKQRNGPLGKVYLNWDNTISQFLNCDHDTIRDYQQELSDYSRPTEIKKGYRF